MFSASNFTEDLCKGELLHLNVMKKNEANKVIPSNFSFLELVLHQADTSLGCCEEERHGAVAEWEI